MPALIPVSWKEFEKFLLFVGCEFKRQLGGHRIYNRAGLKRPIVIPSHGTIPVFVIRNNLRLLGITPEGYFEILKRKKKKARKLF
ncbi:MAG: type II toxin-antitoxin system HicA family toxin [Candidatus Levybacteria bacterium]|nr:type II toxin-antitoxin system HicA family toxin [Candidatus Levybacteria bacterium]